MKTQREKIIVWGAGGHARVVADAIELRGDYEIHGFVMDDPASHLGEFLGRPLWTADRIDDIRNAVSCAIVAVGNCPARLRIAEFLNSKNFELVRVTHPAAVISATATIENGAYIAAGAVIDPNVSIGANSIVNMCASVAHDSTVAEGVHIAPGVRLAGGVNVGRGSWIGLGALVREGVKIGAGVMVGAGSVVVADVPENVTVYGVPAKIAERKYVM